MIGGAGFLGSHLVSELLKKNYRCVVQDFIAPDSASKLQPFMSQIDYKWKSSLDMNSDDVREAEYVVYLAAQADVPLAISSPKMTYDQNVGGIIAFLEALRGAGTRAKTVYISTDNVYGLVPPEHLPITEEEPMNPMNAYAASKAGAELLIRSYVAQFDLPVMILRNSTMYGENSRLKQVIPIFIRQALTNKPITVEGDGSNSRDFNYVGNAVSGIIGAMESSTNHGTWNIASGKETMLRGLAELIVHLTNSSSNIEQKSWRPGEKGIRLSVSIEKAEKELHYTPRYSLEEGLLRTIVWLKSLA